MSGFERFFRVVDNGLEAFLSSPWSDPSLIVTAIGIAVAGRLAFLQNREQQRQSSMQRESADVSHAQYSYELVSTYVHIFRTIFHVRATTLLAGDIILRFSNAEDKNAGSYLDIDDFIDLLSTSAGDLRGLDFNPRMDQAAARLIGDARHRFDIFLWLLSSIRKEANDPGFPAFVGGLMYELAVDLRAMIEEAAHRLPSNLSQETRSEVEHRLSALEAYEAAQEERFKKLNEKAANFIASQASPGVTVTSIGRAGG